MLFILVLARVLHCSVDASHLSPSCSRCDILTPCVLRRQEQFPTVTHAINNARISSDFQGASYLLLLSHPPHHLTRVTQATYSGIPVYELFV
jgi:hypothetical protein